MKFTEIGLDDSILNGLDAMNFEEATPVQEMAIPVIMKGKDVIACAQTGTGKTAAYILPLLHHLLKERDSEDSVKAVIMVPTRELAQQIDIQIQGFAYFLPVSSTVVYGGGDGADWEQQKRGMLRGADIVIATPGRLIAHIANSGVDLSKVKYFILDEADRMLDMGFIDDIQHIVNKLPKKRQTLMFSATLAPKIRELAKQILTDPEEISIAVSKPNESIIQSAYICYEAQKILLTQMLLDKPEERKTIIFSSSKIKVKELTRALKKLHLNVAAMHSDLSQSEREEVMLNFKNNKISIIVATDVIARGIDIEDILLVINYDVPHDPEDYIHRIGRTARADADGVSITFVNEEEQAKFQNIEKFLEKTIYKIPVPKEIGKAPEYNPKAFESKKRNKRKPRKENRK